MIQAVLQAPDQAQALVKNNYIFVKYYKILYYIFNFIMKHQTNNIIEKMIMLPPELQDIIREYIPKKILAFTNKLVHLLQ